MEAHLADCAGCRSKLEEYRRVSSVLGSSAVLSLDEEAARERVWLRLQTGGSPGSASRTRIWRRSVTLPLPVAAAAAALLVVSLGLLWFNWGKTGAAVPEETMAQAKIDLDTQGIPPILDMNGMFQYLSQDDRGEVMILHLPESKSFTAVGEPAIIRAADYSRRSLNP